MPVLNKSAPAQAYLAAPSCRLDVLAIGMRAVEAWPALGESCTRTDSLGFGDRRGHGRGLVSVDPTRQQRLCFLLFGCQIVSEDLHK